MIIAAKENKTEVTVTAANYSVISITSYVKNNITCAAPKDQWVLVKGVSPIGAKGFLVSYLIVTVFMFECSIIAIFLCFYLRVAEM